VHTAYSLRQGGRHGRSGEFNGLPLTIQTALTRRHRGFPMRPTYARFLKYLVAILLGNALYFTLLPYLPPAARHHSRLVDLGTVVDFWFCLLVYGLLQLGSLFRRGDAHDPSRRD